MSIAERIRQHSPRPATLKKAGLCTALGLALLVPGLSGLQAKLDDSAIYEPVAPTILSNVRNRLGSALKTGQLQPGFDIYNLVQQRVIERLQFALSLIDEGIDNLDFEGNDQIRVDRSEAPWEADSAALDQLWIKRIKNAVLAQRLNGTEDDVIEDNLRRRYEGQLKRAYQARSEDAFQAYMNAFTGMWDPHTSYFSPRTSENFNINMSLSLEGIGAVLQSDNEYTKVVRLVPGGPAAPATQPSPWK